MRHGFALLFLLGACSQASLPPAAPATELSGILGEFRADSDTACTRTGNLAIERAGLLFAKGVTFYTRTLNERQGQDIVARDGNTYAALAVGPSDLVVELRRVVQEVRTRGVESFCGRAPATYVALVHEAEPRKVTVMIFSGSEPPGPQATESNLCGVFEYVAPEGARTRQGVVLR